MRTWISRAMIFVFLLLAVFGYIYFGPNKHTSFIRKTAFFRNFLAPTIEQVFNLTAQNSKTLAYLDDSSGEVLFRPSSELVFLSAHDGQGLSDGTTVNTGDGSGGTLILGDKSTIQIEENSTVLIRRSLDASDLSVIQIQVLSGAATVRSTGNFAIEMAMSNGKFQSVTGKNMVGVAATAVNDPRLPDAIRALGGQTGEFLGNASDSAQAIRQRLLAEKASELAIKQQSLAEAARLAEAERLKALALEEARLKADLARQEELLLLAKQKERLQRRIAALQAQRRSKLTDRSPASAIVWVEPPEDNLLSQAIFSQRTGNEERAQKYLKGSLTQQGYLAPDEFHDATRLALDGLLRDYSQAQECQQAVDALKNAVRAYPNNPQVDSWAKTWEQHLIQKKCL